MSQPLKPPREVDPDMSHGQAVKRLIRSVALVLAVTAVPVTTLAVLPGLSGGQTLSSIQGRLGAARGKLDQLHGRAQVLTSDISALSGRIRSLEREIGGLRRRESKVAQTLVAKRAQLERLRAQYEIEHERYLRLRRKLARAQGVLAGRLVAIYKADEPDFVTVVLEADGFDDMLVRAEYMRRIGEQDSVIVDRVRELKQASAKKRALLADLKQQAQTAVDTIEAQQAELAATRSGIEQREGQLAAARTDKRGVLSSTQAKANDVEGDIAALEAASAQVTGQLRSAGPLPAGPVRHGSSGFIWPVSGPVVSPFGMRWGRLHAGVDIAVPSGTPIRAAASGRVAIAGWVGGYGNYTCIQHGGAIATCYGHQSSIGVGVGTNVSQGQVIGSSGCTGHCLGPHVHFEVRVNGTPVDPMGYL
jgi:murein DD-endopeptidase MepM/ murein hydrolase activator NlpD